MIPLNVIVRDDAVNDYLTKHDLKYGSVPLVAALLQQERTVGGQPALLLVVEVSVYCW